MATKRVTCGLLFCNRNELEWHVRLEHQAPADDHLRDPQQLHPMT
jgi:hypothetical protein